MTATRTTVAAMMLLASAGLAQAADSPPGAASCSGCHASSARVETPVPPLKGRSASDIENQMVEFKTGKRPGTM